MKKILLSVAFALLGTLAVQAQAFDFNLFNETGYNIYELYVSPTDSEEWGEDILGEDVLMNGDSFMVTFDEEWEAVLLAFEVEKYDLKVIDEDGDEFVYTELELETIMDITLYLDEDLEGYVLLNSQEEDE